MATTILKGSARAVPPGARTLGRAEPTERLEVSVLVRRRAALALRERAASLASADRPRHLTREEFAVHHGADEADLVAVRRFAGSRGLSVLESHSARRTVVLSGTVAAFEAAFAVELLDMERAGRRFRGRIGSVSLPKELDGVVEAVLGLDNRAQAQPHFRLRRPPHAGAAAALSYSPPAVAALYGFPPGTGAGECVALIELGGGFRSADLAAYFSALKVGSPTVTAVSVDQGENAPTGDANGPDGEVMLDIEVVGAIVPKASVVAYFAPNTDAGFLDAVTTAIHDTTRKPSVISISWGGPESTWTAQAMTAMDEAFQAAVTMGITVCVAAGDGGSADGVSGSAAHVDFPASSPYALACGGTSLRAGAAIARETVWNDGPAGGATGGGVSSFFPVPAWQAGLAATSSQGVAAPLAMRGVPDVAGDADPETGYQVRIDGADTVIGGTSAVAPLWAALITRLNAAAGKPVGLVHPLLYRNPTALRDITQGNNGAFEAVPGWDACTGLGSPNGASVAALPR